MEEKTIKLIDRLEKLKFKIEKEKEAILETIIKDITKISEVRGLLVLLDIRSYIDEILDYYEIEPCERTEILEKSYGE